MRKETQVVQHAEENRAHAARVCSLFVVMAMFAVCCARGHAAQGQTNRAPTYYHLRQGVTFYVANRRGVPFTIDLELKDINTYCRGAQTALLKVYDPDGEVLHEEDVPDDGVTSGAYQQAWAGWDHEMWARGGVREVGAEPLFRWGAFGDPNKLEKISGARRTIEVPGGKGVYRILLAGCDDHFATINLSPDLKFGVLGHPDWIAGRAEQFRTSYLYVPEAPYYAPDELLLWLIEHKYPRDRRVSVSLDGERLPIETEAQGTVEELTAGEAIGRGALSLEGIRPGSVLKLENEGTGSFLLRVNGIPAILCPDPATARYIGGGLERTDDGMVVAFPFQRKLWEAMSDLEREDFECRVKPGEWLETSEEELWKIRVHAWGHDNSPASVDRALTAVNGALQNIEQFSAKGFFDRIPRMKQRIGDLTLYYLYPFEGNRLYHDPALRNIITMLLAKEWLRYRPGEVIYEWNYLNVAYAQGFHWDCWEPIWNMKDRFRPEVLEAFQQGTRRIAQRMFYANALELVITNGRTTVPLNIYHAYLITGDEDLKKLALRHFRRMYTALDGPHSGWSETGYFREHFGADGGYCTYPLYQLGRLYQLSKDEQVLECLDHLCRWMNYCALPNGERWTGPTSWNARIASSALEHIWGSGYKFFAGESKWAATLYRHYKPGGRWYDLDPPAFQPGKKVPDKPTLLLTHLTRDVLPAQPLPADSEVPFFYDVGGGHELFAVRRGGYYALVYAGRRTPFWMDHFLGGTSNFSGGGLTGLYLPGLEKPLILGRVRKEYGWPRGKWEALSVPVVVGEAGNGGLFNTGVCRNQVEADADRWSVRTTGEAINAPVNFQRSYRFGEDAIEAEVSIRSARLSKRVFLYRRHFNPVEAGIRWAWEVIPCGYLKEAEVTCMGADGETLGRGVDEPTENVASVEVRAGGGGIRIELDRPRTVRMENALFIELARDLPAEERAKLSYRIVPFLEE